MYSNIHFLGKTTESVFVKSYLKANVIIEARDI